MKWTEVAQSCPTLCDPIDCSLLGYSVHGIFQAIVLELVAISFSRGSSQPRARTRVSWIVDRHFTIWAKKVGTIMIVTSKTRKQAWRSQVTYSSLRLEVVEVQLKSRQSSSRVLNHYAFSENYLSSMWKTVHGDKQNWHAACLSRIQKVVTGIKTEQPKKEATTQFQ